MRERVRVGTRAVSAPPISFPKGLRLPGVAQSVLWAIHPDRFNKACRRRYGPIFTVNMFPFGRVVYVAEPSVVRTVLSGPPDLFLAGEANRAIEFVVGSRSVLLLDGREHALLRRTLLPPFHGENLTRHLAVVDSIVADEMEAWASDKTVKLHHALQRITLEVMMRVVFGIEDGNRLARLRTLVPRLLQMNPLIVLFPQLRRSFRGRGPWQQFLQIRDGIDEILFAEIRRRRASSGFACGEDTLSALLRNGSATALTDDELRDHLVTLLAVGHETTATATAWLFERLVRHPDVLSRLNADLRIGSNEYLDATIRETLRIRPPTLDVARTLAAPAEVGGYALPRGTMIALSLGLLHTSPDLYPEPERFRPERFLAKSPPPFHYLPFGGGNHRCLGAGFALMEMRAIISSVLRRVDVYAVRSRDEPRRTVGPMIVPGRMAEVGIDGRVGS